jgi:dipeptidase E
MKKRLLLISNSTNFGEPYLEYTRSEIKNFLGNTVKTVLFIPYAGVTVGWDDYHSKVQTVFGELGYDVESIHYKADPLEAIEKAEAIIVGGGNTFNLVYHIHKSGIIEKVREKVFAGTPYIGWSAGSNVACPSLKTTNDMPVIEPPSFNCFNLIPFQINPHYTDFVQPNHAGETREQRLLEFLELNQDMPVLGLREATMLRIEGEDVSLIGRKPARLMKYNEEAVEFNHGDNLNFLLK